MRKRPETLRSKEVKEIIVGRNGPRPAFLIDPVSGCWISTGASQGGEYRMMDSKPAHRAAYVRVHGEIPSGHEVHHLCETKACINVDHLIAVTRLDHNKIHRFLRAQNKRAA